MLSKRAREVRSSLTRDNTDSNVSITTRRAEWENAVAAIPLPAEITLKREEIAAVDCLWVRHKRTRPQNGLIVYVHGGGLVEGSAVTHQEFAARLSTCCQMNTLLIDYRLAPEHVYPAALNDVIAVLSALQQRPHPPQKIVAGGESSGAGLLVSALLSLKSAGITMPEKIFLISGVYDLTFSGKSITELASVDPLTSIDVLKHYTQLYSEGTDKSDPSLSPLFANRSGLPPALVMAGSDEILRSDSESLAAALTTHGVETCLEVWTDLWHAWPLFPEIPEAQDAINRINNFLQSKQ